jgi:SAM-dependent methyltransferase
MNPTHIHYGASTSAVETWLNFDASLTVRVQNVPLLGRRLAKLAGNGFEFPAFLRYGDIVKGLPLSDGCAEAVFASHVLEHLPLADMRTALRNTLRILKPGGTFRLIVPDLHERARRYVERFAANPDDAEAAMDFVASTDLGEAGAASGVLRRLRRALGHARHEWMWDYPAMAGELAAAGFTSIRRAKFGDAADPRFGEVEQRDRFFTGDIAEVAIEAKRPG